METAAALEAWGDSNVNWESLEDAFLAAAITELDAEAAAGAAGSGSSAPPAARGAPPTAAATTDGAPARAALLARFQQRLAARVPYEWSVAVHRFDSSVSDGGEDAENAPPPEHAAKRARAGRGDAAARPQQQQPQQQTAPPQRPRRPRVPGLFASAVGCDSAGALFVFGGLQRGGGPKVQAHADAWMSEAGPMRQLPDESRVLKADSVTASAAVLQIGPSGGSSSCDGGADEPPGSAAAAACPPAQAQHAAAVAGDAPAWRAAAAQHQLSCGLVGQSAALYRGRVYMFGGQLDDRAADYARPAGVCTPRASARNPRPSQGRPWTGAAVQFAHASPASGLRRRPAIARPRANGWQEAALSGARPAPAPTPQTRRRAWPCAATCCAAMP